jgi:hypothetical protein
MRRSRLSAAMVKRLILDSWHVGSWAMQASVVPPVHPHSRGEVGSSIRTGRGSPPGYTRRASYEGGCSAWQPRREAVRRVAAEVRTLGEVEPATRQVQQHGEVSRARDGSARNGSWRLRHKYATRPGTSRSRACRTRCRELARDSGASRCAVRWGVTTSRLARAEPDRGARGWQACGLKTVRRAQQRLQPGYRETGLLKRGELRLNTG